MIYIGIDPGVRMCGVAIDFNDCPPAHPDIPKLRAFTVTGNGNGTMQAEDTLQARAVGMVYDIKSHIPRRYDVALCVEGQKIYPKEKSKGDPNDMVKVAIVAGAMLGVADSLYMLHAYLPTPREWKGALPKSIHHERLRAKYREWVEPVERETAKTHQNHVWDAVGLLEWMKAKHRRGLDNG